MSNKRLGESTVELISHPKIIMTYSIVGPKEGEGPLAQYFDDIIKDDTFGQKSFEKAESKLLYTAILRSILNSNLAEEDIDYLCSGDLLNQITSSGYAARDLNIPFFGLYGACSTMAESLSIASLIMDGGFAEHVVAATSSHFSAAERQFRFPLEYGSQRHATAQWTVTGAGAMVLGNKGDYPYIRYVTIGKVKDYGITDPNNMGAAMAPAAANTIYTHLKDTNQSPEDYDYIITGDLGKIGKEITDKLLLEYGYDITSNHKDCGEMIFDATQDAKAGGSGCGCSAVVTCGYFYKKLLNREIKRILLVSTGALMSPTSNYQGESIPGIAHAVAIEVE